mmetsp:Transcript_74835/g.160376  ORF Transcript_74835/g.160376 Transcript_74835/m.160376 type:complete len:201 (-) Transcript_74835:484-1086(-)
MFAARRGGATPLVFKLLRCANIRGSVSNVLGSAYLQIWRSKVKWESSIFPSEDRVKHLPHCANSIKYPGIASARPWSRTAAAMTAAIALSKRLSLGNRAFFSCWFQSRGQKESGNISALQFKCASVRQLVQVTMQCCATWTANWSAKSACPRQMATSSKQNGLVLFLIGYSKMICTTSRCMVCTGSPAIAAARTAKPSSS